MTGVTMAEAGPQAGASNGALGDTWWWTEIPLDVCGKSEGLTEEDRTVWVDFKCRDGGGNKAKTTVAIEWKLTEVGEGDHLIQQGEKMIIAGPADTCTIGGQTSDSVYVQVYSAHDDEIIVYEPYDAAHPDEANVVYTFEDEGPKQIFQAGFACQDVKTGEPIPDTHATTTVHVVKKLRPLLVAGAPDTTFPEGESTWEATAGAAAMEGWLGTVCGDYALVAVSDADHRSDWAEGYDILGGTRPKDVPDYLEDDSWETEALWWSPQLPSGKCSQLTIMVSHGDCELIRGGLGILGGASGLESLDPMAKVYYDDNGRVENGTWQHEIKAVVGDTVTFRAGPVPVAGVVKYAWDMWSALDTDPRYPGVRTDHDVVSHALECRYSLPLRSSPETKPDTWATNKATCWAMLEDGTFPYLVGEVPFGIYKAGYVCSGPMSAKASRPKKWQPAINLPLWQAMADRSALEAGRALGRMGLPAEYHSRISFQDPANPGDSADNSTLGEAVLPFHNILYYIGHGMPIPEPPDPVLRAQVADLDILTIEGTFDKYYTPNGERRAYEFVFINACASGACGFNLDWGDTSTRSYDYGAATRAAFRAKCFIGWSGKVWLPNAVRFASNFWDHVECGKTAGGAFLLARRTERHRSVLSSNPRLIGNVDFSRLR